ncbi:MAG: serpin family protein [Bacteroidales bacterium]|nr:serpin family protein [Bacteroidales bacterium]
MKKMFALTFIAAMMLMTACDKNEPQNTEENVRQDIALTKAQSELSSLSNDFTFDFMKILATKEDKNENLFASPFSLQTVLAMTAEGAVGNTKTEMLDALKLSGYSEEELAGYFRTLIPALEGVDNTTVMEIANSFWSKQSIVIKDDYAAKLKADYYAECKTLDFDGKVAAGAVNGWCSAKTHGMINKVVDEIPDDQMVALINAIYFKGEWSDKFNEKNNYDDNFSNYDGTTKKVTLMRREATMNVFVGERASALSLPYGNGAYAMTVILPAKGVDVNDVVAGLDAETWREYRHYGDRYQVSLSLPKFETEYTAADICINTLNDMGMKNAFTRAADFTCISDTRLFIDQVIHKAKVIVNEKGTEAAAVSYVGMRLTSVAAPLKQLEFKVDRPFIYAISEVSTGAIVFIGVQRNF